MPRPVTPGWLGGRYVTELCEGACLWWGQLVTLALAEAAILMSIALGKVVAVVRRSGQQDSSGRFRPMFAVKKDNKDPPL